MSLINPLIVNDDRTSDPFKFTLLEQDRDNFGALGDYSFTYKIELTEYLAIVPFLKTAINPGISLQVPFSIEIIDPCDIPFGLVAPAGLEGRYFKHIIS